MLPSEQQLLPIAEFRARRGLVFLGLLLLLTSFTNSASAANFYVSPTGTTSTAPGTGTITNPWALQTALSQPAAVHPGDTIWLRGGTYTGNFTSYLTGTSSLPIVVRQYPGERATLDGNVNPGESGSSAPVLYVHNWGGYTWYWGFEVMNSSPVRTDTPECTYCRGDGIFVSGPGTKIINVIVHDTGQGITFWSSAVDAELYGNIIYYVGWSNGGGVGHSIYTQNNEGGSKLLKHNLLFDGFSYNLHAYGSGTAGFMNSQVVGNVWWRGPSLVGGESGFDIGGTSVTGNYCWLAPLKMGYSTSDCANVTVSGNYLTNLGGSVFSPGSTGCRAGETITGNTFVGDLSGFVPGDYPNNTYYPRTSPPTQDNVTILPNAYEAGRATIVVYNWDGSTTQAVDLTGVVSPGAAYEIRNGQNFFGPPVVSGTYSGGSVTLPMTGLTPATPVGYAAPPSTGPAFAAFVVLTIGGASPPPTPTATNTGPYCSGSTISLSTPTVSGATYSWTGPNGFASALRNPTIPNATVANAGLYGVTVTVGGLTSPPGTTTVVVNPVPATPVITAPASALAGATGLTASVPLHAGSSYLWGITNGTITAGATTNQITFTAGASGVTVLTVVETTVATGCVSSAATANVYINAQPAGLVEDAHATGGTISNVNTVLEPGETVLVNPYWKNIGASPLTLTGTASAFAGPAGATYTLLDTAAGYGTIAPGATADSFSAGGPSYRLSVSNPATRPAVHWDATILETLSNGIAKTWTLHVGRSFTDVPTSNVSYAFVENIYHNGITAGCGGGNYCPSSSVTRWQMAVFLATSLLGSGVPVPISGTVPGVGPYNCTSGGNSLFGDVAPTQGTCPSIHYIYSQGITAGCGGGNYCPAGIVTRGQMAVFLANGMVGPSGTVPTSGTVPSVGSYNCTGGGNSLFGDVRPTDGACRFIHFIYANGVTAGCGGGNYCPASNVTRWQMAPFLVKAFHIPFLH